MVVVLFPVSDEEPALQPAALEVLARLGVTCISLLRDQPTAGLVLEGWALDPARASEAVCAAVGARQGVCTLEPLMQMAVSATPIGSHSGPQGRDELSPPIDPQRKQSAATKRNRWLLVAATILAATTSACTATQPSLTPTAVPRPTATPTAAQTPEPTPAPGTLTLQLTAIPTLTFDKSVLAAPANTAFVIDFNNKDVGQAHNVHILKGTGMSPFILSRGPDVFSGSAIIGPDQTQYYVSTGLAAGQYTFVCSIHPQMVGTLTVQ